MIGKCDNGKRQYFSTKTSNPRMVKIFIMLTIKNLVLPIFSTEQLNSTIAEIGFFSITDMNGIKLAEGGDKGNFEVLYESIQ